jgi:uncharacterized membrane protein YtjA (UPF0391 family)
MRHGDCRPRGIPPLSETDSTMLRWALIFAVIALVAGLFGFTGIAAGAAEIARILFFIFVVLVVVFLLLGAGIFGGR